MTKGETLCINQWCMRVTLCDQLAKSQDKECYLYSSSIFIVSRVKGVILRYSQNTENCAPVSHIHGGVHSLNSW